LWSEQKKRLKDVEKSSEESERSVMIVRISGTAEGTICCSALS